MSSLSFKYIADLEREMVVIQGIAAQIRRVERRELEQRRLPRQKCDSLQAQLPLPMAAVPAPRPATASGATTNYTSKLSAPQTAERRQRLRSRTAGNAGSPSIPLRLLLPKTHMPSAVQRCKVSASAIADGGTFGVSDVFSNCSPMPESAQSSPLASPASINPRFLDAHVEYIDNDCVIHNGMQMVDIGLEYATQRAAPRLISL